MEDSRGIVLPPLLPPLSHIPGVKQFKPTAMWDYIMKANEVVLKDNVIPSVLCTQVFNSMKTPIVVGE